MEVLRPCWAIATSGVPVREQLFNASICHHAPFNLFPHGEFSRNYGRSADMNSLEVATPILIPRSDGHRHRKGSHGDVIFLTNRGEVCYSLPSQCVCILYNLLFLLFCFGGVINCSEQLLLVYHLYSIKRYRISSSLKMHCVKYVKFLVYLQLGSLMM